VRQEQHRVRQRGGVRVLAATVCFGVGAMIVGCGPGPWGFAKYYVPTDEEATYDVRSKEYTYGAITANPEDYQDRLIAWFGVIEKVTPAEDGRWLVRFSYHQHRDRHLCADETSSSCRVTVNFKSSGGFSVLLDLRPEDLVPGLDKVQPGTLMRVFGKVLCAANEETEEIECRYDEKGGVLMEGVWYRQWPRRNYLTTRAAESMRR
jgi:hypothetical protein